MPSGLMVSGDAVVGAASATFALVARESVNWMSRSKERRERRDSERRREVQQSIDSLTDCMRQLEHQVDAMREKLAGFEGVVSMLMDRWKV